MKTQIDAITKIRFLMGINPTGVEITEEHFNDIINSWPRAFTYNYSDATVWKTPWMGKEKWIAMYHLKTEKFYKI